MYCRAVFFVFVAQATIALGHSLVTRPLPISPAYCALAEDENNCAGPCQPKLEAGEWRYDNPNAPSVTYKRGQKVRIKYYRNNHRSGGFSRLSLVKQRHMGNLAVHARNAFHYSCWGANVTVPTEAQIEAETVKFLEGEEEFSPVGADRTELHGQKPAYYFMEARIPQVIPNGIYVLGWVWYAGTAGEVTSNQVQKPTKEGASIDYWTCSYVRIRGGRPLKKRGKKVFVNSMSQFSKRGCRAINARPGICGTEEQGCPNDVATYRKPFEFTNGADKDDLILKQSYYK